MTDFPAFFALADEWRLNTHQGITLLGRPARSTYFKWKKSGGLMSRDTEDRISYLLAIANRAPAAWLRRSNRLLGGPSPLDVILRGKVSDIYTVMIACETEIVTLNPEPRP